MSVSAEYIANVTVRETIETNVPAAASNGAIVLHSGFNKTATLTAASSIPATKVASFQKALSSGTATIDLTSLTGTNGATVVGTGLKVQLAKFANPSTNANSIGLTFGASNPYNLLGAAFQFTLLPGQEITIYGNEAAPDVGSGAKTIDMVGTGAQALNCIIVLG